MCARSLIFLENQPASQVPDEAVFWTWFCRQCGDELWLASSSLEILPVVFGSHDMGQMRFAVDVPNLHDFLVAHVVPGL
eukprot:8704439-Heterocapsa_arctica.AAC.1